MPESVMNLGRGLRKTLDFVYTVSGWIAALFLIAILTLIVLQMLARWTGNVFPGSTDYAGYGMATASFLAMAYALNAGAHIRVSLFLMRMSPAKRRWAELWCFGVGAVLASYFAFYAIKAVRISYKLNDISQGQDATPLWIPQIPMAVGMTILAIALIDHWIRIAFGQMPEIDGESVGTQIPPAERIE